MSTLLSNLLQHFVSKKSMCISVDGNREIKSTDYLVKLDLGKKENFKSDKFVEVGTKAKLLLHENVIDDQAVNNFRSSCLKCYVAATSYLQANLPYNNKVIQYAQYLHPEKRNDSMSTSAISNLALKLINVFGKKANNAFEVPYDVSQSEIIDMIRHQWKMYQLEQIPKSSYVLNADKEKKNKRRQNSYWQYAREYCGIFPSEYNDEGQFVRLDDYWCSVKMILNENGKPKYPQLFSLAKSILSLSHGNVVPERGFSINKYMLSIHGNSIQGDTITSLPLVKDQLCLVGGLLEFKITTGLLKSVKSSYSRYQSELLAKREIKEKEEKAQLQKEQDKASLEQQQERQNTIILINQDISFTKESIKNLEQTLKEANDQIAKSLKGTVFRKEDILKAHTLI